MAYYADRLSDLTLAKPLRASAKVCLKRGVSDSSVLIGFFHSKDSTAVTPSQDSGIPKSPKSRKLTRQLCIAESSPTAEVK